MDPWAKKKWPVVHLLIHSCSPTGSYILDNVLIPHLQRLGGCLPAANPDPPRYTFPSFHKSIGTMRKANVDGEVGIGHFRVNYSISVAPQRCVKNHEAFD